MRFIENVDLMRSTTCYSNRKPYPSTCTTAHLQYEYCTVQYALMYCTVNYKYSAVRISISDARERTVDRKRTCAERNSRVEATSRVQSVSSKRRGRLPRLVSTLSGRTPHGKLKRRCNVLSCIVLSSLVGSEQLNANSREAISETTNRMGKKHTVLVYVHTLLAPHQLPAHRNTCTVQLVSSWSPHTLHEL